MRVRGRLRLRRLSQAPMTGYVPHRLVGHRHRHRPVFRIPVKKKQRASRQKHACVCMYMGVSVRPSNRAPVRPTAPTAHHPGCRTPVPHASPNMACRTRTNQEAVPACQSLIARVSICHLVRTGTTPTTLLPQLLTPLPTLPPAPPRTLTTQSPPCNTRPTRLRRPPRADYDVNSHL